MLSLWFYIWMYYLELIFVFIHCGASFVWGLSKYFVTIFSFLFWFKLLLISWSHIKQVNIVKIKYNCKNIITFHWIFVRLNILTFPTYLNSIDRLSFIDKEDYHLSEKNKGTLWISQILPLALIPSLGWKGINKATPMKASMS